MTFLHTALAIGGFACVAIPIIIHFLFRQRRKPIKWAAMRFLMEALRKQRRRLRLEQLLLLATRCLLLAALAAAIGRPLLEKAGILGSAGGRTVYFLIDNSLASTLRAGGDDEPALVRLKKLALDQLATLGPGDRAGLITLAAPADALVVPASPDLRAIASVIDGIEATDAHADLAGALEDVATRVRADRTEKGPGAPTQVVVLSDFLQGSADLTRTLPAAFADLPDVSILANESSRPATTPNVQVTGVEPLHAVVLTGARGNAQDAPVRVTLRRSGAGSSEAAVSTLRLGIADAEQRYQRPPMPTTVRWQPGQTETSVTVQLNTDPSGDSASGTALRSQGAAVLVAELDRDGIAGDNLYRRPVSVRASLQVGIVAQRQFGRIGRADRLGAAEWLRLALQPSDTSPIEVTDIEPSGVDGVVLANLDAVFVPAPEMVPVEAWPRLRRFVDDGGLLVVSPTSDATVHLWTDAFAKAMGLDWRMARETETAPGLGWNLDDQHTPTSIFALLEAELAPLLKPVTISKALLFQEPPKGADVLLKMRDSRAWLVASVPGNAEDAGGSAEKSGAESRATGRGLIVYLASAPVLTWTDLPARPLMVPFVQEIVKQGVGRASGTSTSIAGLPVVAPPAPGGVSELRRAGSNDASGRVEVDRGGLARSPVRTAGVYQAIDQAGRKVGVLAVNADASAGRIDAQDPASVHAWLTTAWGTSVEAQTAANVTWIDSSKPSTSLATSDNGSPVSVPLLIAALVLALAETAMARWFSHARRDTQATAPLAVAA